MAGQNIDPHDQLGGVVAGENLSAKQFFLVYIKESNGKAYLATTEKQHCFSLQNAPEENQYCDLAGVLSQVKVVAAEEIKAGALVICNNEGKLKKATNGKGGVIGVALSTGKTGALIPVGMPLGGIYTEA
jgi:predicted transcriptional regulator